MALRKSDDIPKRFRIKIPKKKKIAFVCSGGATKAGAFHLGVALALQEKGFKFKGGIKLEAENASLELENSAGNEITVYVGSSAGSIICSYLASGYSLEQIFDSFLGKTTDSKKTLKRLTYTTMFALRKDTSLMSMWSSLSGGIKIPTVGRFVQGLAKGSYDTLFKWKWLKLPGFFSTSGIEKYLREDVLPTNSFSSLQSDLFIVATQLNHSRKVVFGKYNYSPPLDDKTVVYIKDTKISQACAASTALPLIFAPYPIENERGKMVYYFDGEIRDTLSTHVGFDSGADLIIASYTHQPYHFVREVGSLHEYGMPAIMIQALYLLIERKIQSSMSLHHRNEAIIKATAKFFKENNLSEDLRAKFIDMLERKLGHRQDVDYIYIHPKATEHHMFFGDHFNLSPNKMSEIVRIGFRSGIDTLRKYDFSF